MLAPANTSLAPAAVAASPLTLGDLLAALAGAHGKALVFEYDGRAETIKLITRAQLIRLENDQQRDELRGSLITYNSRSTEYNVDGAPTAGPEGRVRAIIAPRNSSPAPEEPADLKRAPAPEPSR